MYFLFKIVVKLSIHLGIYFFYFHVMNICPYIIIFQKNDF